MRNRVLSALVFISLVAVPVWAAAKKGSHGGGHSAGASRASSGATHSSFGTASTSAGKTHASPGATHTSSAQLVGGPPAGTVPDIMSGYHSSAGYGSLYGWGYNDWTHNGWHDGQWHAIPYSDPKPAQPSVQYGGSKASYASGDETQLIQEQIARRRAQQAPSNSQPSQPATTAPQKP